MLTESVSNWTHLPELPPPRRTPWPADAPVWNELTVFERQLLTELAAGDPVLFLARTRTKVDVGLWFRRLPLWLACLPDRLALFAHGARPFREQFAYSRLRGSLYNHVTGELVLAEPDSMEPFRTVALPIDDALQVLAQVYAMEER